MLSIERREAMKNILLEKKSVTVADMVQYFDVSAETIRRDMDALANDGILEKTYGGATLVTRVRYASPRKVLSGLLQENKRRIAKQAAKHIHPNDSIFLDHSTTVEALCDEIENMNLTVMTNSLAVIEHFSAFPNIQLVIPGGNFFPHEEGIFGMEAIRFISSHSLDRAFLSCKTLNLTKGIGVSSEHVSTLFNSVLEYSDRHYLLADHTKFNKSAFITACELSEIDYLLTDEPVSEEWEKTLRLNHVQLEVCP